MLTSPRLFHGTSGPWWPRVFRDGTMRQTPPAFLFPRTRVPSSGARHAVGRCDGVAVGLSRGVPAEPSRGADSHRQVGARRRTEAGHGPVRRSQGLDGAARGPRSRGSTQDLDPVLAHMMDAVHRYEGTVN